MAIIYPSLIAADLLNLEQEIKRLDPHCAGYHLDIMDDHFVPNLTFGPEFINAISQATRHTLWVHLMVDTPQRWIDRMNLLDGSMVSFHLESTGEVKHMIRHIKGQNWRVGIAIKPETLVEEIFPILDSIDQVLLMSVEPGFSGQPFLKETLNKLDPLVGYRKTHKLPFAIAMDGGISKDNIRMLAQKGVDEFAIAAAIFRQSDPVKALQALNKFIEEK